jgi:hypothetical protein
MQIESPFVTGITEGDEVWLEKTAVVQGEIRVLVHCSHQAWPQGTPVPQNITVFLPVSFYF